MQNVQIQEIKSHKPFGTNLSSDCSWHQHISYIKDKAWLRINIMRKLKFKLDRKSKETIYILFIRPLLEYENNIWDNCTQADKMILIKFKWICQNSHWSYQTGLNYLAKQRNLMGTLQKRRNDYKWTSFFKMYNYSAPALVPQQVNDISGYNLRNSDNLDHTN